tara:strand:+ start:376 stop:606 length:231 start_codon:yes stop_codon:yes gene_type:complete
MPLQDSKLQTLVVSEGFENFDDWTQNGDPFDSVIPGICMNVGCTYTAGIEPDQEAGYCEACGTTTVKSAMVLAGII